MPTSRVSLLSPHRLFLPPARTWLSRFGRMQLLSCMVIGAVAFGAFYPDLTAGFWWDDFGHLDMAGRLSWLEYFAAMFDPRVPRMWYRPVQQLQWWIQYMMFGGDALWYHMIQNTLHVFNCLLLFSLITRLSHNWRVGLIGGLVYSVLPAYSVSVFWPGVPDPLAASFCLGAIWFWVDYLEDGRAVSFGLAFAAFVFGQLTKEVVLTLPITLLLVDRWLVSKRARWYEWILRVAPFFFFLLFWGFLEWNVISGKVATESSRADLNGIISNQLFFLSSLTLPWGDVPTARYASLVAVLGVMIYALTARKFRLAFLGVVGAVSVMPMASSLGADPRYLYLPAMVWAGAIGAVTVRAWSLVYARLRGGAPKFAVWCAIAGTCATLLVLECGQIAQAETDYSLTASRARVQFRPIYQQHASFEPETLLYFVDLPTPTFIVSGMMFARYGKQVYVRGNDEQAHADLRKYNDAYVIYPDDHGVLQGQRADPAPSVSASPSPPVQIGPAISLEGFEAVNTRARPGEAIVLILYFRAFRLIDRDYTVFAHLLDAEGNVLAGHDSQPHQGAWPTTTWTVGNPIEDPVILPITSDIPAGDHYRIEIGMYYLPTMERLPVAQPNGKKSDVVEFSSFTVEP